MNWEKLTPKHYYQDPVEHIHSINVFDAKQYDKLYENQNNFEHPVWQEFDAKYKTGFEFKEDITEIDFQKEIIAFWFFRERSDQNKPPQIDLAGKLIPYTPNTFLLTACKDITIQEAKNKYIRRPFIQLDLSTAQFNTIIKRLR
tara:strand:+ start:1404 stop:1835 length:432 start_codon:yes stop_codon:yes gene_type:complete